MKHSDNLDSVLVEVRFLTNHEVRNLTTILTVISW